MSNYEKEQETLTEDALRYLEMPWTITQSSNPAVINLLIPFLRLWHFSRESDTSWIVFVPRPNSSPISDSDTGSYLIRRVTWHKNHDLQRFTDPLEGLRQGINSPPTISVDDVPIAISTFHRELNKAVFPIQLLNVQEYLGVDRDESGVETYHSLSKVHIRWKNDGPKEWQDFIAQIVYLRHIFDNYF
jgi:hypothetical protein